MRFQTLVIFFTYLACQFFFTSFCQADESDNPHIHIASAANFRDALQEIVALYQQQHPAIKITVSTGSSGSLFQQSLHGAPFDIFLSADTRYPEALANALNLKQTPQTYAIGELVLWNTQQQYSDLNTALSQTSRLAIANPNTAPYGKAALSVLKQLSKTPPLIKGNSIGQVFQFIKTGNTSSGFIARSQTLKIADKSQLISIPQNLYPPLEQQGLRLNTKIAAKNFFRFLWQPQAQTIMQAHGYQVPMFNLAANPPFDL